MTIKIKPSHRGELRRETHTPKNKVIATARLKQLTKSRDEKLRRQAQFALNARKWRHN